MQLYTRRT